MFIKGIFKPSSCSSTAAALLFLSPSFTESAKKHVPGMNPKQKQLWGLLNEKTRKQNVSGRFTAPLVRQIVDPENGDMILKATFKSGNHDTSCMVRDVVRWVNDNNHCPYKAKCISCDFDQVYRGEDSFTVNELKELGLKNYDENLWRNYKDLDEKLTFSIQEYGGITLSEYIQRATDMGKPIPRRTIANLFLGLISILRCMCKKDFVHADADVSNLLIQDGNVRLIDFGFHGFVNDDEKPFSLPNKPLELLPYLRKIIGKRRRERVKRHIKIDRNTRLAQDLWSSILMLFELTTTCPLFTETFQETLSSFIERKDWQSKFGICEDRLFMLKTVVNRIYNDFRISFRAPLTQVQDVYDNILKNGLGEPIRKWLDPEDTELIKEQQEFDEAYNEQFSTEDDRRRRLITLERIKSNANDQKRYP